MPETGALDDEQHAYERGRRALTRFLCSGFPCGNAPFKYDRPSQFSFSGAGVFMPSRSSSVARIPILGLFLIVTALVAVAAAQIFANSSLFQRIWLVAVVATWSGVLAFLVLGARRYANHLLLLFSTLIPLYGIESYLTSSVANDAAWRLKLDEIASERGKPAERDPVVLFQAMRSRGMDPYMYVHPFQHISTPLVIDGQQFLLTGAVPNKQTVHCRESSGFRVYQSDRYGYDNPDQVWDAPVDIVFVGASFVHGACVDPKYHFAGVVRATFPGTLSLGASGSGPLHQLMSLREFGPLLKPRIVFWMHSEGADVGSFFGNSPYLYAESKVPFLLKYLDPTFRQNLSEKWPQVVPALEKVAVAGQEKLVQSTPKEKFANGTAVLDEWEHTKGARPKSLDFFDPTNSMALSWSQIRQWLTLQSVAGLVQQAATTWKPKNLWGNVAESEFLNKPAALTPQQEQDTLDLYKRAMARAKADVASWGGRLVVVWVTLAPPYEDAVRARTLAILRELEIPVVDTHSRFKTFPHTRELLFARNGAGFPAHYSEEGNLLLAKFILGYLSSHPLPAMQKAATK